MKPLRLAGQVGLSLGLLLAMTGPASADSGPQPRVFVNVVRASRLIVLVTIHHRSDGGYTFDVERVLKGSAGAQLVFAPTLQAAVDPGWARAVIAFSDPTQLDFRTPTIAWHVAPDGRIDPEGYQQFIGLPPTLDAMIRYFDTLGMSDKGPMTPAPPPASMWPLAALVGTVVGLGLLAGAVVKRRGR
jgi:hypothetical protein